MPLLQPHVEMTSEAADSLSMPTKDGRIDFSVGNKINQQASQMDKVAFTVTAGRDEICNISGADDMMLHPLHLQAIRFPILSENGQSVAAHRQGWKDIVRVEDGGQSDSGLFSLSGQPSLFLSGLKLQDSGMKLNFTVQQGNSRLAGLN